MSVAGGNIRTDDEEGCAIRAGEEVHGLVVPVAALEVQRGLFPADGLNVRGGAVDVLLQLLAGVDVGEPAGVVVADGLRRDRQGQQRQQQGRTPGPSARRCSSGIA